MSSIIENQPLSGIVAGTVVIGLLTTFFLSQKQKKVPHSKSGVQPPPQIPSYVPFLGPIFELGKLGFRDFTKKYSAIFNDAPLVTAKLAGKTLHLVAEPAAFPAIFRYNMDYLSMAPVARDFSDTFFGMSQSGLVSFDSRKEIRKGMTELLHKHLLKSDGLHGLSQSAHRIIDQHITSIVSTPDNSGNDTSIRTIDLYTMVRKVVFRTTLETMVCKSVANDDFIALYEKLDGAMKTAVTGLPLRYFAPEAYKAREELVRILKSKDDDSNASGYLME